MRKRFWQFVYDHSAKLWYRFAPADIKEPECARILDKARSQVMQSPMDQESWELLTILDSAKVAVTTGQLFK
jgi:hypothetical protein